ncbi:pentapeptide repeat-containing protein [Candidatus Gracilibacteria bacterium]|nr:pentapeptide repeat-containing protein [Candidatus Gracilibacteria bacterium]
MHAPRVILINVDMAGCRFVACNLNNSTWVDVKARNAIFRGMSLRHTLLRNVNMNGADLQGVDFSNAILENVRLHGANLRGANFTGALLKDCSLRYADLRDATFLGTEFKRVDTRDTHLEHHQVNGILAQSQSSYAEASQLSHALPRMDEQAITELDSKLRVNGHDLRRHSAESFPVFWLERSTRGLEWCSTEWRTGASTPMHDGRHIASWCYIQLCASPV